MNEIHDMLARLQLIITIGFPIIATIVLLLLARKERGR